MKPFFKKIGKFKKSKHPSLTITDALGSSLGPVTSTSTIRTSCAADPIPSIPANPATANVQVSSVTTAYELQLSTSVSALAINNLAPIAHLEEDCNKAPSSSHAVSLRSTESEQRPSTQHTGLGFFANARNPLIAGGTFVNCENYNVINVPTFTGERQIKTSVPQKPNSSLFFTGRKDVLDKIGKIFIHHTDSRLMSRHSCLLWGMGGIGKTQICLKFTEEMSDRFSYVFWVDASSHENITMSLKGISSLPAAQVAGVDGSAVSVLQWISHIQEEWLIVFDNADDLPPDVVAKFIPPGNRGNILITSRNPSMGRVVSFENRIEINEMEEQDAIALLLKASCLDPLPRHLQAARKIVNELGCIPLAVDHAGAYIEAGKCDINEYLRQFSLHRKTLMSDATFTGASNYDQTVYGTWDLSFKEIKKRAGGQSTTRNAEAAKAAILILQICAFYHHSNISRTIFQSAAESRGYIVHSELPQAITLLDHTLLGLDNDGHWDAFIFGQGIGVLLSFSLIKRGQSSEIFSVHPLVHCWSREQMSKSEQQRIYEMGSIILSCAIPWGFATLDYAFRQMIFPHIKANDLYGSQMRLINQYYDDKCFRFSQTMWENGDRSNAEQLMVQVMHMRKKLLGAEHPDTLTSMGIVAGIYGNQGGWKEAEQLAIHVMDIRNKLFGAEHPDTLAGMAILASIYCKQGRWNQAVQLGVHVMDIMKKLLGINHPDTFTSMADLAIIYCKLGRWNEAEQLGIQVMDMRKNLLGAEHLDTLSSMAELAIIYCGQGRWNEAEMLSVHVMEMMKKWFGAEHPETLTSMVIVACACSNQGRWNEAEQLSVQIMDTRKNLLGAEHPDTLMSMANLAIIYYEQGRWNEAEMLGIHTMKMMKKWFGAEHPDTLASMADLSITYREQGRWNEAEQLGIQVMNMRKMLFGAEHPDTLTSMANVAVTYQKQGRWNEAEQLGVQAMGMRKKLLGANHPDTLSSMADLAIIYCKLGRCSGAEQLCVQVMDMRKKLFGAEHPGTLTSMMYLAVIYSKQKRCNEAEQLGVHVMETMKRQFGAEHPDTLTSMANVAITYCEQGRWNEAEQLGVQVMDMRKRLLGVEHPDTLTSIADLSVTYCKCGKWRDAEKLGVYVMDMMKKFLGAEHPNTLTNMENLAVLYHKQGRQNEAKQLKIETIHIRKRIGRD